MIEGPGSFTYLMTKLTALERNVHERLRVYRWQPVNVPDLPAIWNWMGESPFSQKDQMKWEDAIQIFVRIGIPHTEIDQDMERIETYTDAFREVVDDALYNLRVGPLEGAALRAERTSMRNVGIEFNGVPVFCVEFPITFHVERRIEPNN